MNAPRAEESGILPTPAPSGDWIADFAPYSWNHVVVSTFFLSIIAILIFLGLRWRSTPRENQLRLTWGTIALATQTFELYWWCRPSFFRIWISLPIHVCDLAAWFAVAYLLTGARLMRVLLYYFGLFLSSQAFFTPVIGEGEGIGTIRFWLFFIGHTHIVGVALYDVIVLKYRPSWRDFFLVCTLGSAYVIAMIFLNRSLHPDANYGFLGPRDKQPAIIQSLGTYPMRIVWMSLIVIALFAFATAIWRFRRTPSRDSSPVRPS